MYQMLVGSHGIRYWFPDARIPKDIDYFSPVEMVGCDTFWHDSLREWKPQHHGIATPDELYTVKISHAFWNLHGTWRKHINDTLFLARKGAKFIPELFDILYPIWEETHGPKAVRLNVSKDEFFADRIVRKYDHDSLHRSVAYYDRPLYERVLKDSSTVAIDKAKFDALSYEDKLKLAREEIYANALERKIIPSDYTSSPQGAYMWSVQQTITSLSKGWFPLFVVLNYDELRNPDVDYVTIHKNNADRLILLEEAS